MEVLVFLAIGFRIFSNPLANVFQKQLTNQHSHPLWVNFLTYALLSVFCLAGLIYIDLSFLPMEFWLYSVLGGIFGAVGNALLVKALQKGDLSILGPINAYKSIIGLIFGIVLLREIPDFYGISGVVIIIFGSYLVLNTTEERFSLALLRNKEIQFRIGAMVLTAIEAVFVKKVILSSSPILAFFSWCLFGAIFSFFILLILRINPAKEFTKFRSNSLFRLLLLVLCIGLMQLSTNFVFEYMDVAYALSIFQLSILVSVLLGYRVFHEKDIRQKIIGSVIMIAGSVLIILFGG